MDPIQRATADGLHASAAAQFALMDRIRGLVAMTRPSVVALVFFTGVPMLGLLPQGWPSIATSITLLAGIAAIAGASSVFNAWIERDLDARMVRTRGRPLPRGVVSPNEALCWGVLLALVGEGLIFAAGEPLGAVVGLLTILFYVFVYTIWLKPRTPLNIVIGGAAGAAPPLIVDASQTGSIGLLSMLLFTLVFLWTPPHFWAISLFRKTEYAAAGFPMMPITHGDDATRVRMVLYALAIIPFSTWPVLAGHLTPIYGVLALGLGFWFAWKCERCRRERTNKAARSAMLASLVYLHLLFTAMAVDVLFLVH